MEGRGDELPVSAMPVDGTYPSGTTKWEKRNISDMIATWEPDICIPVSYTHLDVYKRQLLDDG